MGPLQGTLSGTVTPPAPLLALPGSGLAVSLGSRAVCRQSRGALGSSGEDAEAMCRRCFGRVYKNIAEQLLRPAWGGACVIPAGKRAQGGDGIPGFWGHPASSLP